MIAMICICHCCLITNCPRGGKRNGHSHHESNVKQVINILLFKNHIYPLNLFLSVFPVDLDGVGNALEQIFVVGLLDV